MKMMLKKSQKRHVIDKTTLPVWDFLDSDKGEIICLEYGSSVPSYNFIIPAKI